VFVFEEGEKLRANEEKWVHNPYMFLPTGRFIKTDPASTRTGPLTGSFKPNSSF